MRSDRRSSANTSQKPEVSPSGANAKRRGFLLAVGVGGAGAAAMAARSLSGVAPVAGDAADAATGQGYRLTDHVKRYYQSTKT